MAEGKDFIVTLKEGAHLDQFKAYLQSLGAEIKHEYTLIRGFAIKLPGDHVGTLENNEHVASVEPDSEVKIN
ncbi:hypothetical protein WICPIJ_004682 [Wickerhamomyces pijperi]|uniref:Inhibitor I9 domain-containing protein n=1 Tax=Wickerhamomyces pijperi TaxID=599730 RepID=A0A9P8TN18_WICPI|nr:hypothetical protein WICPIJ_004682 [Wickerhamomyces pijperi]